VTIKDVVELRLVNQQLTSTKFTKPAEIVEWFGATQSQLYEGGKWAIGLRLPGSTDKDIERAIADRKIVRTWPMRGTLHFVAARDVRWILKLLTPRVAKRNATYHKHVGLDEHIFNKSREIVVKTLEGEKQVTRPALYKALNDAGISTKGLRGLFIISFLAHEGLICFGPRVGKQQTLVLLDEWLAKTKIIEGDEAITEIAKRYFTSHGPATIADFTWWTGLTVKEANIGIDTIKNDFESFEVDGKTYWFKSAGNTKSSNSAFLLPAYDEYTVGYTDRSAIVNPDFSKHPNYGFGGILNPVIVINGQVLGTWKKEIKKSELIIKPSYFEEIRKDEILDTTKRYAKFLGYPEASLLG